MFFNAVRSSIRAFLDLIMPPLCLSCDQFVSTDQALCAECWTKIDFITPPYCACCGMPFDLPVADDTLCGNCLNTHPSFAHARAAMVYNEQSRGLILGFKHGDRTHGAIGMANMMYARMKSSIDACDLLIPVPLHRWRLWSRRYNQSALLAIALGKIAQKPVLVDALVRTRATASQGHSGRKERFKNVHKAFALHPRYRLKNLGGMTIGLIDDVLTTGATADACTQALLSSGVAKVNVCTLARVKGRD